MLQKRIKNAGTNRRFCFKFVRNPTQNKYE